MLILAMDTATPQVGVAVGGPDGVTAQVRLAQGRRHAEQLAPAIEYVMREAGVSVGELAAVAVGVGPGLFTGLRVGVTTAKVMAMALKVPVVAVPSLDLVAHPLRHTHRELVVIADARRGEVYWTRYHPVPGGVQRTADYLVSAPQDVIAEIEAGGHEVLLAGDGARLHAERFERLERAELAAWTFAYPSPAALVELACARYSREDFCQPSALTPMYLRKSDAELNWERAS